MADDNWTCRLLAGCLTSAVGQRLRELAETYKRTGRRSLG
jgi:hypothetical protein